MINKVGYTDNRTSFGAYWKVDENHYLDKLYNTSIIEPKIIKLAEDLRYKAPKHELEITKLTEGTTSSILVKNNATGSVAEFRSQSLGLLLRNALENLNDMAKNKVAFWNENKNSSRFYRLLTGQKDNSITKI
ncbi:hypothetical protein J6P92_00630 [bacterium]|nr:hypothetical protein [bacterium]